MAIIPTGAQVYLYNKRPAIIAGSAARWFGIDGTWQEINPTLIQSQGSLSSVAAIGSICDPVDCLGFWEPNGDLGTYGTAREWASRR